MNSSEELTIPTSNFNSVCRLCLSAQDKLYQLFRPDEVETSAIPLSMRVTLCTAVRMSKFDLLPQNICANCLVYINEWYKFRKKCVRVDAALKQFVSSQSSKSSELSTAPEQIEKFKYCNIEFDDTASDDRFNILLDAEPQHMPEVTGTCRSEDEPILTDLDQCSMRIEETQPNESDMSKTIPKLLLRTPTNKFKCSSCPDSFYYQKDLKQHQVLIHRQAKIDKIPRKPLPATEDQEAKLKEVNVRTRYEMKCCDKVFFSKARFRKHYNKKHPGEKPFMCDTCGKRDFISEETLKRHKVLHTGKFRCEICSKTFTCNAILIIHKRDKHENDKPFICDVCGKRFVTELLMNYHKRFHTGEKKYVCEECGLAVVTSSSLAKHKRIHSNVKPHICQICGKGFIIKGRLVEHLRVHTGERPYSCNICNKGFTMRDKLKRHVRIHSGEKLFYCEYCGNNYSTSYGLSVHLKSHVVKKY